MKKRFIILLNSGSAQQNAEFVKFIKGDDIAGGYWHWLNNSWLMVTQNVNMTSEIIRDKLREIYPGVHNLVLELREDGTDTWNGFGPSGEDKNMFKWIHANWTKSSKV